MGWSPASWDDRQSALQTRTPSSTGPKAAARRSQTCAVSHTAAPAQPRSGKLAPNRAPGKLCDVIFRRLAANAETERESRFLGKSKGLPDGRRREANCHVSGCWVGVLLAQRLVGDRRRIGAGRLLGDDG